MSDISDLKEYFEQVKDNEQEKIIDIFKFTKELTSINTLEYLDYHYSLLERSDIKPSTYDTICRAFNKRNYNGEDYLLERIRKESDEHVIATVLQILGRFKYSNGRRLNETADLARNFLHSESSKLRCRALWVIGWVGNKLDIGTLGEILFKDDNNENRGWAATAMMQIFFNDKCVKYESLKYLNKALDSETNPEALVCILVAIQEITEKKLGISSSSKNKVSQEKIEKAKIKAKNILSKM